MSTESSGFAPLWPKDYRSNPSKQQPPKPIDWATRAQNPEKPNFLTNDTDRVKHYLDKIETPKLLGEINDQLWGGLGKIIYGVPGGGFSAELNKRVRQEEPCIPYKYVYKGYSLDIDLVSITEKISSELVYVDDGQGDNPQYWTETRTKFFFPRFKNTLGVFAQSRVSHREYDLPDLSEGDNRYSWDTVGYFLNANGTLDPKTGSSNAQGITVADYTSAFYEHAIRSKDERLSYSNLSHYMRLVASSRQLPQLVLYHLEKALNSRMIQHNTIAELREKIAKGEL